MKENLIKEINIRSFKSVLLLISFLFSFKIIDFFGYMSDYEVKLVDSSRALIDILAAEIGCNSEKYSEMFTIAIRDKYPLSMRAARVLQFCTEKYPSLVLPYLKNIISLLDKLKVDGGKRSFLKMIMASPTLPDEDSLGLLIEFCFTALQDNKQAIAIRAYSIDLLLKIILFYPDLAHELILILESREMEESAGMKRKHKHILNLLRKMQNQR